MILALHGNIGSPADFEFLSGNEEVNAVNLWPYAHLSLPEVAAEMRDLAANEAVKGIIGYSMGGRIALQSIADAPDFWDFAIILSADPGYPSDKMREERLKKDRIWAEKVANQPWSDFLTKWNNQSTLSGPIPESQIELEGYRSEIAQAFINWSPGNQVDLRPALQKYRNPLTWVVGGRDEKFRKIGEKMKSILDGMRLIIVPEVGHRILLEAPEAILPLFGSCPDADEPRR